jgi:hypothetical protein
MGLHCFRYCWYHWHLLHPQGTKGLHLLRGEHIRERLQLLPQTVHFGDGAVACLMQKNGLSIFLAFKLRRPIDGISAPGAFKLSHFFTFGLWGRQKAVFRGPKKEPRKNPDEHIAAKDGYKKSDDLPKPVRETVKEFVHIFFLG